MNINKCLYSLDLCRVCRHFSDNSLPQEEIRAFVSISVYRPIPDPDCGMNRRQLNLGAGFVCNVKESYQLSIRAI